MPDTIVMLQLEHKTLSSLLALADSQLQKIESGKSKDFALLHKILEYFCDYPDACHHPKEDAVFRRLLQRNPEVAADIGNLISSHDDLSTLTRQVGAMVQQAHEMSDTPTDDVVESMREFISAYREHIRSEEVGFFPAASTILTREDWDLIDYSVFERDDPIFDVATEGRFRDLREAIFEQSSDDHGPGGGFD